jgi:hypothetical protein
VTNIRRGIDQTAQLIRETLAAEQIPYSHSLIDCDGVGGVTVILRGVKAFVNGSSEPKNKPADARRSSTRT